MMGRIFVFSLDKKRIDDAAPFFLERAKLCVDLMRRAGLDNDGLSGRLEIRGGPSLISGFLR